MLSGDEAERALNGIVVLQVYISKPELSRVRL